VVAAAAREHTTCLSSVAADWSRGRRSGVSFGCVVGAQHLGGIGRLRADRSAVRRSKPGSARFDCSPWSFADQGLQVTTSVAELGGRSLSQQVRCLHRGCGRCPDGREHMRRAAVTALVATCVRVRDEPRRRGSARPRSILGQLGELGIGRGARRVARSHRVGPARNLAPTAIHTRPSSTTRSRNGPCPSAWTLRPP